jgi:hypothetical protein
MFKRLKRVVAARRASRLRKYGDERGFMSPDELDRLHDRGAWSNRPIHGSYPDLSSRASDES